MADSTRSVKSIISELRDINKEKRRTAVMKLGMIGGEEASRALIRTLENEYEDLIVRGRAAMMLGKLGETSAVSALIRALNAPGYQTPLYAAQALGMIGDDRAIIPLVTMANAHTDRLHDVAVDSLQKLGFEWQSESETPSSKTDNDLEPEIIP
ncbi:HEAT repeat domain-containing protein [Phototrophicus methaneseepsis]|uniref:HEAT repeat domain-containing protein n=1 Tax=Phototrophicus methaneseepsis TaxID=2710758 RepID=A0A7S8ED11_9CHLR|nr:HEAT repeat domain-containing protein [Phototrophicus methaneseepsis]QPC84723.1 HEAT repeat domain-containing protein [Phototrophicus methaneseepsis]